MNDATPKTEHQLEGMATMTTTETTTTFPEPAGAVEVYDWELLGTLPDGSPNVIRGFTGSSWTIERPDQGGDVTVTIEGVQRPDGSVERHYKIDGLEGDPRLIGTSDEFARAVVAAQAEIAEMTRRDEGGLSDPVGKVTT
jgi:hypothetical protein